MRANGGAAQEFQHQLDAVGQGIEIGRRIEVRVADVERGFWAAPGQPDPTLGTGVEQAHERIGHPGCRFWTKGLAEEDPEVNFRIAPWRSSPSA